MIIFLVEEEFVTKYFPGIFFVPIVLFPFSWNIDIRLCLYAIPHIPQAKSSPPPSSVNKFFWKTDIPTCWQWKLYSPRGDQRGRAAPSSQDLAVTGNTQAFSSLSQCLDYYSSVFPASHMAFGKHTKGTQQTSGVRTCPQAQGEPKRSAWGCCSQLTQALASFLLHN